MPASRSNYIVWYDGESQIYTSGKKEIALESPPPNGKTIEEKHIGFIAFRPDDSKMVIHELPKEEVISAELKIKEKKQNA